MKRTCRTCRLWINHRCAHLGVVTPSTFSCAAHAAHATRKLDDHAVHTIRSEYGHSSSRALARRIGVSHTTVIRVVRGLTYKGR